MADEPRHPVAIRSLRPYATEEAFLAEERDTLTRTAVTLIGAPSRPRGVVIRFELTLNDGTPLLRGEGRVLSFEPAEDNVPSSLTLRFTRLDAKSKALVDRAAEMRESIAPPAMAVQSGGDAYAGSSEDGQAEDHPTDPPESEPEDGPTMTGRDPLASTSMDLRVASATEPPPASEEHIALSISSTNLPLTDVEEIGARIAAVAPPAETSTPTEPRKDQSEATRRESLLDRLRSRAKTLSPSQVASILAVPRSQS